jgi:DNA-binding phage protein
MISEQTADTLREISKNLHDAIATCVTRRHQALIEEVLTRTTSSDLTVLIDVQDMLNLVNHIIHRELSTIDEQEDEPETEYVSEDVTETMYTTGDLLWAAMDEQFTDVAELSEKSGVSRTAINRIIHNETNNPHVKTRRKLEVALGLDEGALDV